MDTKMPKHKPKVILIMASTPPPYGGGEIMCEILVRGLKKESNHRIIHINTSDNRGNANRGKIDLVNVGKGLWDLIHLIKDTLTYKPDIVYIPIAKSFIAFFRDSLYIISSSLLGVEVISHLHGGYFELNKGNKLKELFVNFVLKRVHTLLVLGENIKQRLKKQLQIQNFVVLYNGISPIIQEKSDENKEQDEQFHVLFIGNLRGSKGVFDILKAIPLVLQETDQIDFWFAGEWPSDQEKDYALNLIKQNGIEKHVKFWGLITGEEKSEFFNRGNVLVHPTYYDGQPIVLLEAMSVGLPIISTDIGSIAETVIDNKNGFIIPTGSPDKIAEKILLLYRDGKLRMAMSAMSKKIYETKFTEEVFLTKVQEIFNQILA